uniref:3HCDH_N domain-containing protein n=1 Tax=Globodera pallida TaxID=36090 RepID=A0A183BZG0_GLOPA
MLDRFLGHFLSLSQIWGGGRKTGKYRRPRARYYANINVSDLKKRVEMFSFVKSAQRFYSTEPMVKNLTVIGSGLMGAGIAQVSAQANVKVVLVDQNQAIIDKAKSGIESSIKRVAKKQFENDSKKQDDLVTRAKLSSQTCQTLSAQEEPDLAQDQQAKLSLQTCQTLSAQKEPELDVLLSKNGSTLFN